jgi:hypothetical protein
MAKDLVTKPVEDEIREVVDEMIDIYLDNLRLRHNIKKKKTKKPKNKKKREKKKRFPGDG